MKKHSTSLKWDRPGFTSLHKKPGAFGKALLSLQGEANGAGVHVEAGCLVRREGAKGLAWLAAWRARQRARSTAADGRRTGEGADLGWKRRGAIAPFQGQFLEIVGGHLLYTCSTGNPSVAHIGFRSTPVPLCQTKVDQLTCRAVSFRCPMNSSVYLRAVSHLRARTHKSSASRSQVRPE